MNIVPVVSIVIPNFNCLDYLPRCIESIRTQRDVNYEIIVIDDGSTDGSLEWLKAEEEKDVRLHVYAEKGLGAGAARNLAVQISRSELIAFLDADDYWYEGKLSKQLRHHQYNSSTVLSFSDYEHIEEHSGNSVIGCFEYWPRFSSIADKAKADGYHLVNNSCATLFAENVVGTSSVMIKKSAFLAVSGFDTSLTSASDWDLWLKLSQIGEVAFTNEKSMGYLMRAGSMTSNKQNRLDAMEAIIDRHLLVAQHQLKQSVDYAKARLSDGYREMYLAQNEPLKSLRFSLKACYYVPTMVHLKSVIVDSMRAVRGPV